MFHNNDLPNERFFPLGLPWKLNSPGKFLINSISEKFVEILSRCILYRLAYCELQGIRPKYIWNAFILKLFKLMEYFRMLNCPVLHWLFFDMCMGNETLEAGRCLAMKK